MIVKRLIGRRTARGRVARLVLATDVALRGASVPLALRCGAVPA